MMLAVQLPETRVVLAVCILLVLWAWESAAPFFGFSHAGARVRHGFRNVAFGVANAIMTSLVFVSLWWAAAGWSARSGFGLLYRIDLPTVVEGATAVLLLDGWTYLWHRMNHRIPFLWRFHRMHHSDAEMDVTTANRFHIGEILLSSLLRIPLIALFGITVGQLAVYEMMLFAVVQFHHANISLPESGDRALRLFIVTPFMHKVHHSRWQPETDSNYSSLFSFWDRLFRSFRLNPDPHSLRLGLDEFDTPRDHRLVGMLTMPVRRGVRKPKT